MAWFATTAKTPQGLHFGREVQHEDHRGHRKLLLVRHGQTDYNVKHLLPGQLPGIPLNAEGQREAEATAQAIQALPLTTIVASPLERTMQTANAINAGRGLTVREESELMDTDYGVFSGQSYDTLDAQNPQWKRFVTNANFAPKGVESFAAVQKRAVRAAERWRTAPDAGEWVALVTHADLVKLIIGHYLAIPLGNIPLINMDNAAISLLTFHPEIQRAPTLLCFNWTSPALWLSAAQKQG
ncbi:MAG: histidine phosphatase family protein [Ktedonobacterales bacterium]|nr:histidine phosphatase family protein [Ktedonobacterales bacterium]